MCATHRVLGVLALAAVVAAVSPGATAAECDRNTQNFITAAYQLGFGRQPDTAEGSGQGEMRYWCGLDAYHEYSMDEMQGFMAEYMTGSSPQQVLVRKRTIKRAYVYTHGRNPIVGDDNLDIHPCEMSYWDHYLQGNRVTFYKLTHWFADYAQGNGYSCWLSPRVPHTGAFHYFRLCGTVPFDFSCAP
jgi:hypothetical protein